MSSEWQFGEPPKDGTVIKGRFLAEEDFYRFRKYKPDGARQMGVEGRWQRLTEYGGWKNCAPPTEWRKAVHGEDYE